MIHSRWTKLNTSFKIWRIIDLSLFLCFCLTFYTTSVLLVKSCRTQACISNCVRAITYHLSVAEKLQGFWFWRPVDHSSRARQISPQVISANFRIRFNDRVVDFSIVRLKESFEQVKDPHKIFGIKKSESEDLMNQCGGPTTVPPAGESRGAGGRFMPMSSNCWNHSTVRCYESGEDAAVSSWRHFSSSHNTSNVCCVDFSYCGNRRTQLLQTEINKKIKIDLRWREIEFSGIVVNWKLHMADSGLLCCDGRLGSFKIPEY